MPHLQIITASTRQGRQGPSVAAWFIDQAVAHAKFEIEPIDLADVNLPLFDEPAHPRLRQYAHAHTKAWSAIVSRADAFVIVTPEYDYGPPASIVNALQYLVHEWSYKPMAFVSYGGVSAGTRSLQGIRLIATALKMVPLTEAVSIPFFAQHIDKATGAFSPGEHQERAAHAMLDELLRWAEALRPLRA